MSQRQAKKQRQADKELGEAIRAHFGYDADKTTADILNDLKRLSNELSETYKEGFRAGFSSGFQDGYEHGAGTGWGLFSTMMQEYFDPIFNDGMQINAIMSAIRTIAMAGVGKTRRDMIAELNPLLHYWMKKLHQDMLTAERDGIAVIADAIIVEPMHAMNKAVDHFLKTDDIEQIKAVEKTTNGNNPIISNLWDIAQKKPGNKHQDAITFLVQRAVALLSNPGNGLETQNQVSEFMFNDLHERKDTLRGIEAEAWKRMDDWKGDYDENLWRNVRRRQNKEIQRT